MIAKRAKEIKPFIVMDVLERARAMEREGINIIHLEAKPLIGGIPAAAIIPNRKAKKATGIL